MNIFVKLKMPSLMFYHYHGEGDNECLDVPLNFDEKKGHVLLPKDELESYGVYEECKERGLILEEVEINDLNELDDMIHAGIADRTH